MKPKYEQSIFRSLFTWKDLETLINIRPLMSLERVVIPNVNENFRWNYDKWMINPQTYPSKLLRELIEDNVCYFQDMSRYTEELNSFASSLEDEYNESVDAHIYVCRNTKIEHPFGIHYDFSDNVIVQCEGTTNFKVWNQVDKNTEGKLTINNNMNISDNPILDVDMNLGDAIWIPKYCPHLATSATPRMSVSFPISGDYLQERDWVKI